MKTQKFSEKQLKDLVAGKVVVTVEPVKKGEYLIEVECSDCKDAYCIKGQSEVYILKYYGDKEKKVCQVGEVCQAVNEKSEKQWYCPKCKAIYIFERIDYDSSINYKCPLFKKESEFCDCELKQKPLLVCLKKIEDTFDDGKLVITKGTFWLKTWKVQK